MRRLLALILLFPLLSISVLAQADQDCAEGYWEVNNTCVKTEDITLAEGWNQVVPGGDALCAFGDPYMFWVRPGSADLVVYFEGGGGCWSAETCEDGSNWYSQRLYDMPAQGQLTGIFDFDHPENPFLDATMIYAPSCTGDVYMGSMFREYSEDVQVYHHGFINGSSVMRWIYETVDAPESIFVTGCSAGSVGSAIFAPRLIEHYPGVPVRQLGDSLAFIFPEPVELQSDWNAQPAIPEWMTIDAASFWMPDYYTALAQQYPEHHFGMFNTQFDRVQVRYYVPGEAETEAFAETLNTSLETIHMEVPNFYSFTAGGNQHCILWRDDFYEVAANGVRVRDWVAAYAAGEDVESIHCEDCERAEIINN